MNYCESLEGRKREICEGKSGLPVEQERAYVERWVSRGDVTEDALLRFGVRGLGDVVKKVTDATGITRAVKVAEKITGKPCGCPKRQKWLNDMFPMGGGSQPAS